MSSAVAGNAPLKRSVAVVVFRPAPPPSRGAAAPERDELLAVRRPADDEDLPDAWGLPAGSLRPGESWEEAVARAGSEKLGVELGVGPLLGEGAADRGSYRLHMRLFEAVIRSGEPRVPQPVPGVTQYAAWEWATPDRLAPAAERGSLCSRLCLDALRRGDRPGG